MGCVYVTKWASLCIRPRLEMYKMAGFDAGNALAGLTSALAPRVLALLPIPSQVRDVLSACQKLAARPFRNIACRWLSREPCRAAEHESALAVAGFDDDAVKLRLGLFCTVRM
jgi:hypothetical protein